MNDYFFFWLSIGMLAALLELSNPGLFLFLSVTGGAIVAALSSIWLDLFEYQFMVFFIATCIAIYLLRYELIAGRLFRVAHHPTNVERLQGKRGHVVQTIAPYKMGAVKLGGEVWSACSIHEDLLVHEGQIVEVVQVVGAHVRVKKFHSF